MREAIDARESTSPRYEVRAALTADIAGYARLMEVDSDRTAAAWQAARSNGVAPSIAEHTARIVKHTGDGFLAEFSSVQGAVECAVAMRDGLASIPLGFRMGLNLGKIIDDGADIHDEDIHGKGVNITARNEALAKEGGISISGGRRTRRFATASIVILKTRENTR